MLRQADNYFWYRITPIMILSLLFFACVGDTQEPDLENPILNTHFTFHQDVNKLYFGLETKTVYHNQQINSVSAIWFGIDPVSYTHLRAHETLRYLVCRLLLEK